MDTTTPSYTGRYALKNQLNAEQTAQFAAIVATYAPDLHDPAAVEVLLVLREVCTVLDFPQAELEQLFGARLLAALLDGRRASWTVSLIALWAPRTRDVAWRNSMPASGRGRRLPATSWTPSDRGASHSRTRNAHSVAPERDRRRRDRLGDCPRLNSQPVTAPRSPQA